MAPLSELPKNWASKEQLETAAERLAGRKAEAVERLDYCRRANSHVAKVKSIQEMELQAERMAKKAARAAEMLEKQRSKPVYDFETRSKALKGKSGCTPGKKSRPKDVILAEKESKKEASE